MAQKSKAEAIRPPSPATANDYRSQALTQLRQRAGAGDEEAIDTLRELLALCPEVVADVRGLADEVEEKWLRAVAAGDPVKMARYREDLDQFKAEVGGDDPTPLVRLLADHLAVCHLAVQYAESAAAEPAAPGVGAIRLKRAESAQRRFSAAVKLLALVQTKFASRSMSRPRLKALDAAESA